MDRRREPRISVSEPVWITVLGDPEIRFQAEAVDLSGRGMRLKMSQPLPPGSPVKVELRDSLYLGDVCYSLPENDRFVIGLAIDQVLTGLRDLARLRRKLAEDAGLTPLLEHADTTGREHQDRQIGHIDHVRV